MLFIVLLVGLDVSAQVRADFRYAGGVIEADSASMSVAVNRHRMLANFLAHTARLIDNLRPDLIKRCLAIS